MQRSAAYTKVVEVLPLAVRNTSFRAIFVMIFGQTIYKNPKGLLVDPGLFQDSY